MGTRNIQYLLFDLPSDHEIEGSLATECDLISTMLANQKKAGVTKVCKYARADSLKTAHQYPYEPKFVHLAGHGSNEGLSMLGETLSWAEVAQSLTNYVKPLVGGKHRILSFSCCHSEAGANACSMPLRQYFTGAYFFKEPKVGFDATLAVWAMFYSEEPTLRTHKKIAARINRFLGRDVLQFLPFFIESPQELERISNELGFTDD